MSSSYNGSSGFSSRMNKLLDISGFIRGRGRKKEFADFLNTYPSNVGNWLEKDISPRDSTIQMIVSQLIQTKQLPVDYHGREQEIFSWLKKGNIAGDPFSSYSDQIGEHSLRLRCYLALNDAAQQVNIDLNSVDNHQFDLIFTKIHSHLCKNRLTNTQLESFAEKLLLESITV